MLYITTAIYPEAAAVLKELPLKKTASRYGAIYTGPSAHLIVTGAGTVSAALSVSEALTLSPPKDEDLLLNIGLCAAPEGAATLGEAFFIHKITEAATGRDYYPDMMFSSAYPEASLMTVPTICKSPVCLTDMEASAVYQAGRAFFSPDRMLFYKIVSDFGASNGESEETFTPDKLTALLTPHIKPILKEASAYASTLTGEALLSEDELSMTRELLLRIDASATMEAELRQLVRYLRYRDGNVTEPLRAFLLHYPEPVHRKEGKVILEAFRKYCLT